MFNYPFQEKVISTLTYCLPLYYKILFENSLMFGLCGGAIYTLYYASLYEPINFNDSEGTRMLNNITKYTILGGVFIGSSTGIMLTSMLVLGMPPIISVPIIVGGLCIRQWYIETFIK
jgi:hypothetical protein